MIFEMRRGRKFCGEQERQKSAFYWIYRSNSCTLEIDVPKPGIFAMEALLLGQIFV